MAKGKKKLDSKSFAQQKRHRRQWITFMRMCRYGINNFSRNAWLTVAATAVMTITLFVIFTSVAARNVLIDTVDTLRDKVDMSIYLKTDTTDEQAEAVAEQLRDLPSVIAVQYISPTQAREQIVQQNKDDPDYLEAIKEATNRTPGTLRVKVVNINNTDELNNFVSTNELLKASIDSNRKPSFAGERRASIETIGRAATFAQQIGIGASSVFVIIAMLIIFNTIRMAIFNRREEIQMMKLIGAEKAFIRGPFLVEAIVYGFIAALIATALGYLMLFIAAPSLASYQINIQSTLDLITNYAAFVLLGMILIGAIIGITSSLLATRRYLKL